MGRAAGRHRVHIAGARARRGGGRCREPGTWPGRAIRPGPSRAPLICAAATVCPGRPSAERDLPPRTGGRAKTPAVGISAVAGPRLQPLAEPPVPHGAQRVRPRCAPTRVRDRPKRLPKAPVRSGVSLLSRPDGIPPDFGFHLWEVTANRLPSTAVPGPDRPPSPRLAAG
jgi:hypothetical protein